MKYTRIDRKGRAADGWKKRVHEMNNNELKKQPKKALLFRSHWLSLFINNKKITKKE